MSRFFSSIWKTPTKSDLKSGEDNGSSATRSRVSQEESYSSPHNEIHKNNQYNRNNLLSYKNILYMFNRLFTYFICILYCYYITLLWKSAYSRSIYEYVPIPRTTVGFRDVFLLRVQDITLYMTSLISVVVFAFAIYLCYFGYLVPGSIFAVGILYVVTSILSNSNIYNYYYRESTEYTHVKGDCFVLLIITVVHYVVMLFLLPHRRKSLKRE